MCHHHETKLNKGKYMRKFLIVLALLIVAAAAYLGYAHISGGAVPTFGLPIGGEKMKIRRATLAFFEHVKFKNTSAFTNLVSKDVSPEELDRYLTKTLGIDPDQVDLVSTSIDQIELDSNQTRARVKVHLSGQDLSNKRPLDISKIIFLYQSRDDIWLIDTRSIAVP